jgi:phage gpG-like protein
MSVSVRIDLNGVDRRLKELKKLDDLSTPLKRSGTYMERSIGMRFRQANWTPLSPKTIELHPHRAGGKPLNDTGKLKMSVTSRAVKQVTNKQLRYGTNLVYAPIHNFGGTTGYYPLLGARGKIPKREFLYFDEKNERAIKKIFSDYIKELSE